MYYHNLENLTFFLLLAFRSVAYQPTATAEITKHLLLPQVSNGKQNQHATELICFFFTLIGGHATTDSIPGKPQLPLIGLEAQLKIIFSAEQSEQTITEYDY